MHDLQHRQEKIQEKRKKTSWRDFVLEICSRLPANLYRNNGSLSRYPKTGREGTIKNKINFSLDNTHQVTYNENISLFDQVQQVWLKTEKIALPQRYTNENVDFVDNAFGLKDGYVSFGVGLNAENVCYSFASYINITNVFNSIGVNTNCENIFSSTFVSSSYNIFNSFNIHNCSEIRNSKNLIGCHHCISCDGLENQTYCIENKQYTKEIYHQQKVTYLKNFIAKIDNIDYKNFNCKNCDSSGSINCNNITNAYFTNEITRGNNLVLAFSTSKDLYDGILVGDNSHDFYGVCDGGSDAQHVYCSAWIGNASYVYYSIHLESCSYCLGCIGLKNKQFCIFNKQYTKEERHEKVDEIFSKMEQEGTLGNFFPGSMNPFYFNDTAAYLIDDSFTKEEVEAKGYLRRDEVVKVDIPEGVEVVKTSELGEYEGWRVGAGFITSEGSTITSDSMKGKTPPPSGHLPLTGEESAGGSRYIDPSILKKVIQDEQGNVYRIVKMEYDFLMKHGLPLPRLHRLERLKKNFKIT